jgi:hypothetical protein
LKLQGVLEVFWANSFEGVLGVVRKSRWVVYSVFYCIFKTKFFEKNKGVHEEPPLPSPMCIYGIKLENWKSFLTITNYKYKYTFHV